MADASKKIISNQEIDKMLKKKAKTPRQSKWPWGEIKSLYFANISPSALSKQFGIPMGSLNHKMFVESWAAERAKAQSRAPKTLSALQVKNKEAKLVPKNAPDSQLAALKEDWLAKGEKCQYRVEALTDRLLTDAEDSPPPIENMKDLATLIEIKRKNLGLEDKKSEGSNGTAQLVNIQFLMGRIPLPPQ